MQQRMVFEDKSARYWPVVIVCFIFILGILFNMGLFVQSVHCENKNCYTETSSLFGLINRRTEVDQVNKVEYVSKKSSKGRMIYNIVYSNNSKSEYVWREYTNLNKDARDDIHVWLTKGMYGNSVHEAKTYTNSILWFCLVIIGFMIYFFKLSKKNINNPAKIEIYNGWITLVDIGGTYRVDRKKLSDIIEVVPASASDLLHQRFGKWSMLQNKRTINGGPRGVKVTFKDGKSICVGAPNITDQDVQDAIRFIKASL